MPIRFEQASLSNGLRVVAEIDPHAHTSAAGFFVKTGARDEAPAVMGVSHFLEHMMFKGTAKRTAEDVDRDFDDIGADHNAFTSSEMTAFWAHTLPENLPRAVDILADIMRPALRQEDFDAEKKVILEEIAMYEDNPFWVLYEKALETYYGTDPMAHRVLGTNQTITGLKRDQMVEYFTNRYSSDNTVVALAGNVSLSEVVGVLERGCGKWTRTGATRQADRPAVSSSTFTTTSDKVNRHYLLMLCPGPSQQDDQRYAAAVLSQVLGDAEGSRLYWALVETGLAEEAQAQHDPRDGAGDFLVFAVCSPDRAEEVQSIAQAQMRTVGEGLTEDDLERVRNKIATGITLHGELPAGRMRRLGRLWMYGDRHRTLEEELKRINAVTVNDLRALLEQYPLVPVVTGSLAPE